LASAENKDQVIALAGIVQQAALVETLAKTGHVNNDEFTTSVNALLCQNPDGAIEVFGKLSNIELGLSHLIDLLSRKPNDRTDSVRYVMGIMHLQKQLRKRDDMLEIIGSRLSKSQEQYEHFDATHENVISGLASIYTDTISQLSFRIQVMGEYNYLQQQRIANQIRTLLFTGIRSAVLWRQMGGSRFKILTQRKAILETANDLLKEAKQDYLMH